MPELIAEEAIALAGAIAAGTARLSDEGRAAWAEYTRTGSKAPAGAGFWQRRRQAVGKRPIPAAKLALMGVAVAYQPMGERKG